MARLTMQQATTGQHFHFDADGCTLPGAVTYGKTGKAQPTARVYDWRRNGRTQTWKTRPDEFRIPVKFGMYGYGSITHNDHVHLADECPALAEARAWWDRKLESEAE